MKQGPTPDEFFEAELDRHQKEFDQGYRPALLNAALLCGLNGRPMPEWLWQAVISQLVGSFRQARGSGRAGRTGGPMASADMDLVHFLRWDQSRHWLANRKLMPGFGYKATRDGVFEFVSQILSGHRAQGSADAIKRSYNKVQRASKRGNLDRYKAAGHDLRWWR